MLKLYFVLLLGLLVLGQFTSLTKAEGLNLYFFDLFALYFVLYGLVCLKQKKVRLVLPKNIAMLLLFSFVAFSSWLLHAYRYDLLQNLSAIFYLVRFVIYLFSAVVVYNAVKNGLLSKEFVYGAFITGGVALVVAGILQLILLPDFEVLDQSLGWDPHKNRLAATFFDPNFLGCYLVLCFFVLAEKFRLIKLHFGLKMFSLSLLLLGIILTFSRSTWLMFSVGVLLYGLFKNRFFLLFGAVVVVSAYYAVPRIQTRVSGTTDPADSAQFRLISWRNTYEIIKDSPWVGVGYNNLRYVQKDYGFLDTDTYLKHSSAGSDSSLLYIWATTGLLGLIVFISALYYSARTSFLSFVIIVSLLVQSQFTNSLFYPQILFLWLVVASFDYLSNS